MPLLVFGVWVTPASGGRESVAENPTGQGRVDPDLAVPRAGDVQVVVQAKVGAVAQAERTVRRVGGHIATDLPLIGGFSASVPAASVAHVAADASVAVLSLDRAVRVQGALSGDGGVPVAPRAVRAPEAWAAGATGRGVTVAVVDTGIADVPALAGRIVAVHDDRTGQTASCYDLSGEGSCADSYGHGTFMAGLIAGNGAGGAGGATGTAPEARLLSIKVAGADGAADVSTVLAAIQWVVSFRDRYNVRVLNLSLGTDSTQAWQDDPLNYAVERAWAAGIAVVVAASNRGPQPGTIAKPGDDPWVVTVGAIDDRGTPGIGDDQAPDFSSRGPTAQGVAKPDVVAPGGHVLSLRAPGSTLDKAFAPADASSAYRTGSGTSMAAAVVSGVAAVALQRNPGSTPDQLKYALTAAGRPVASADRSVVGGGLVDAYRTTVAPAAGHANSGLARSSGRGDLAASRGSLSMKVDDPLGTVMTGRQTAQLLLWDPLGFTTGSWSAATWYNSAHGSAGWNTASWSSTDLEGHNWTGHNWTGHNWTGHNWTGQSWSGHNWTGHSWSGSSWYEHRDEASGYGRYGPGSASYGAWD